MLGRIDGALVGLALGALLGNKDGATEGSLVRGAVGVGDGIKVAGIILGMDVGCVDVLRDGLPEGFVEGCGVDGTTEGGEEGPEVDGAWVSSTSHCLPAYPAKQAHCQSSIVIGGSPLPEASYRSSVRSSSFA